jgi:hypothetical protein
MNDTVRRIVTTHDQSAKPFYSKMIASRVPLSRAARRKARPCVRQALTADNRGGHEGALLTGPKLGRELARKSTKPKGASLGQRGLFS